MRKVIQVSQITFPDRRFSLSFPETLSALVYKDCSQFFSWHFMTQIFIDCILTFGSVLCVRKNLSSNLFTAENYIQTVYIKWFWYVKTPRKIYTRVCFAFSWIYDDLWCSIMYNIVLLTLVSYYYRNSLFRYG